MKNYLKFIYLILSFISPLLVFGQESTVDGGLDISIMPREIKTEKVEEFNCHSPRYIAPSNLTHNSASFSWLSVKSAVKNSYIMYLKSETDLTIQEFHIKGTFKRFNNLTPNTSYEIKLHAVCGESSFSDPFTLKFHTLPTPILEAPNEVALENATHQSARIRWTPSNGAKEYDILYRASTEKDFHTSNVANLSIDLERLQARSLYEVKIISKNAQNVTSLTSANFTFWTLPSYVAALFLTPNQLRIQKFGTSAHLHWVGDRSINRFNVYLSKDDGKTFEHYVTVQQSNAIFTDLEPNTKYKVKVEAIGLGEVTAPMSEILTFNSGPQQKESELNADNDYAGSVTLAPNPTTDAVMIRMANPYNGNLQIRLTDVSGKVVLDKEAQAEVGQYYLTLPTLSRGIYQMRIRTRKENLTTKLVVN